MLGRIVQGRDALVVFKERHDAFGVSTVPVHTDGQRLDASQHQPSVERASNCTDRILVERLEEQEQKRGGIIIPDTAKEKPQEGKVIAVGTGKVTDEGKRLGLDVKVGDKILFGKYSGSEVQVDGHEYMIMREEDILAILS